MLPDYFGGSMVKVDGSLTLLMQLPRHSRHQMQHSVSISYRCVGQTYVEFSLVSAFCFSRFKVQIFNEPCFNTFSTNPAQCFKKLVCGVSWNVSPRFQRHI